MRVFSTLIFLCLLTANAFAQGGSPREFDEGNQLYSQGKFAEAKQQYDSLVRSGNWSSRLFYNLADAEWKLGDFGAAALNYERALALEPSLSEARANLQFVQNRTGAKLENPQWWQRAFPDWSASIYAALAAVGAWTAIFSIAATALRSREKTDAPWLAAAGAAVCVYALGAILLFEKDSALAVVTAKRADARFAPADTAAVAEALPTASRIRVLQERGAWTYVELPDRARAWIATESIERVRLPRL